MSKNVSLRDEGRGQGRLVTSSVGSANSYAVLRVAENRASKALRSGVSLLLLAAVVSTAQAQWGTAMIGRTAPPTPVFNDRSWSLPPAVVNNMNRGGTAVPPYAAQRQYVTQPTRSRMDAASAVPRVPVNPPGSYYAPSAGTMYSGEMPGRTYARYGRGYVTVEPPMVSGNRGAAFSGFDAIGVALFPTAVHYQKVDMDAAVQQMNAQSTSSRSMQNANQAMLRASGRP